MTTAFDLSIFKSYDVRGIYPTELGDDIAKAIGREFVDEFDLKNVVVGRDMRLSGEKLYRAFARGATEGGADVTYIGEVSVDELYFAVGCFGFDGGVMITASHNPANYNGMKFMRENAIAVSLETGLSRVRDRIARNESKPAVARQGTIVERDVLDEFVKHVLSFVDSKSIRPMRIAIDAGNGMAGKTIPAIFAHLPCEIIPLYIWQLV